MLISSFQVICSRCSKASAELKSQIKSCLEGIQVELDFNLFVVVYTQLSFNQHPYKMDTSIRWTPGIGPVPVFLQLFTVTKLPIRQTPLYDRQLEPVPTVSVFERVDCIVIRV